MLRSKQKYKKNITGVETTSTGRGIAISLEAKKKNKKSKQKINEVYVYNKFYFQILNESKAFILLA